MYTFLNKLFHVAHQCLTQAITEEVLEHATQLPGTSTSSMIEISEGSDVALPQTVVSKRPKPPVSRFVSLGSELSIYHIHFGINEGMNLVKQLSSMSTFIEECPLF
jgi:hypothetical protein